MEEIRRVVSNLSNPSFIEPSLTGTLDDGTVKKDWEIPTTRLITSLSDPDWKVRARAAMLLGFRREKGVTDILLQTARTDTHLIVAYYASASFKYVTRPRPRLVGEEPFTPSEAIDMLNTDKLEQWWKEHSAEVYERLADMK